ncbi:MAG: hypothetical protein COX16_08745 [Deltaproteobacteria bacterium CG23_combo_of_CG06-09_8_20_14_all_51_20]|nr:MAG: hypothetical protein COX16_08745 [Deltaproteobacteria bacterium CG23_combo_of_CG06-09_8_20_14_all_51_20]PIY22024.1 MAG: hypothetical protein COZ11_14245 [Deltaproteobacteria bacterium CG_4_10_14_3_um_filter_51_14]
MRVIFIFRCAPKGHERLYENTPSLYSSPSTGEGGVGVIFILCCAPTVHEASQCPSAKEIVLSSSRPAADFNRRN